MLLVNEYREILEGAQSEFEIEQAAVIAARTARVLSAVGSRYPQPVPIFGLRSLLRPSSTNAFASVSPYALRYCVIRELGEAPGWHGFCASPSKRAVPHPPP